MDQRDSTSGLQVPYGNRKATPIVETCKVCRDQNRKQRKSRKSRVNHLYAMSVHYPKQHALFAKMNEKIS